MNNKTLEELETSLALNTEFHELLIKAKNADSGVRTKALDQVETMLGRAGIAGATDQQVRDLIPVIKEILGIEKEANNERQ